MGIGQSGTVETILNSGQYVAEGAIWSGPVGSEHNGLVEAIWYSFQWAVGNMVQWAIYSRREVARAVKLVGAN